MIQLKRPIVPGMKVQCKTNKEKELLWQWFLENGYVRDNDKRDSLENLLMHSEFNIYTVNTVDGIDTWVYVSYRFTGNVIPFSELLIDEKESLCRETPKTINQSIYLVKAKINKEWKRQECNLKSYPISFKENNNYSSDNNSQDYWIKGCLIIMNNKPGIYQYRIQATDGSSIMLPVEPDTICRPIGWKDSDGESIYEKDIVELISYGGRKDRYLIWWNQEMSMMTAVPLKELVFNGNDYSSRPSFTYDVFCLMMQDPYGDFERIKIIGNIIDNPELVNQK